MVAHDGGTQSRLALASHCSNSTSTPPPFPQNSCTKANPLYLSRANPTTREAGAPVLLHKVSPPRIRVSEKNSSNVYKTACKLEAFAEGTVHPAKLRFS